MWRGRWGALYLGIAFAVLVPVASYKVITMGLPKKILLFVIPCYLFMSWSSYRNFKYLSKSK
jgi:hypothetical protein